MTARSPSLQARRRAVGLWLLSVAALVFITLIVGGATRLTESGLSIVEWKPVTGVLPPLDAAGWQSEFDKYKTIPQYRERNLGMSLDEFKTIYWWEWSHRMLARLVGAAFLIPFLWFLWRGAIEPRLRTRLWSLFGLGAALGAVGWWMVSSGLADRISVSQYRLAFHLTLACGILAGLIWTAADLLGPAPVAAPGRVRAGALSLVVLVLLQVYLGALVAGLRAGLIYNTWPLIDGSFVPDAAGLLFLSPWWRNLFENPLTVQFDHRMAGYAVWLLALIHAGSVMRAMRQGPVLTGAVVLASAVTLQAGLGIATLMAQAPLLLALAHQAMAIVVLTIAVVHARRFEWARIPAPADARRSAPVRGSEQAT
ncbi:MAG TPA: COX15/CtaA family protein [Xanthobacteraceae bacterium]|jgi:cytochrome c oxidase assembly protein subunit 15